MKKQLTAHIIFAATALASQQAWALGFGRVVSDAVLGQSLTFTVPVRLEPGERFGIDCVSAEVYFGDSRVQPDQVRAAIDQGSSDGEWLLRISTLAPVQEPVVEVAISAGCQRRLSRRFTLFADPPTLASNGAGTVQAQAQIPPAPASSSATALPPIAAGGRPSLDSLPGDGSPSASTSGTVTPAAVDAPLRKTRKERAAERAAARAAARAAQAQASARGQPAPPPGVVRRGPTQALANALSAAPAPYQAPAARGAKRPPGPSPATAPAAVPATAPRLVLDGGYAHLKLDMEDPVMSAAPAASGNAATMGLSDLDDPDTRQLRALEQSIQAMKREQQANRDNAARLQAELADAQSQSGLLPYALGLLALAIAAAAALAWRLRRQSKLAHSAWFTESQINTKEPPVASVVVEPPPPAPVVAPPPPPVPARDAGPSIGGELEDDLPQETLPLRSVRPGAVPDVSTTSPLDRAALANMMAQETDAPRELSVEELLDLEQQADFFIALGQEDAAVDLLMSHLRSAGGQSPLPYTKLLEIYRRQGDRSAYERTRARFNRRFNAYAPDWDTGPSSGRSLEDYPETVAQVQATWHSPINAMAVLEALLFKRDDTSELFDLPAYRDVLVLYSLARDLWQHDGGGTGTQVDVLLPLDDADFAPMAPQTASAHAGLPAGLELPPQHPAPPMSFEMTGFEPLAVTGEDGGGLDLEIPALEESADLGQGAPQDDSVHATLDTLSLAPIEPPAAPPSSLDWDFNDSKPGGSSTSK